MAWDITTATYVAALDVSAKETAPRDVYLTDDGMKLFVTGSDSDAVHRYDLSTAYDITTATFTHTKSVATQATFPYGVEFSPDGTKMFVMSAGTDVVHRYDLSTAWDVTTASAVSTLDVSGEDTNPRSMTFSPDGTKMFMVGSTTQKAHRYDLSTAWDLTTATAVSSVEIILFAFGIHLSPDGTKMFVTGTGPKFHRYDLSTAWDLTTATDTSSYIPSDTGSTVNGVTLTADGSTVLLVDFSNDQIDSYDLNPAPSAPTLTAPVDNAVVNAAAAYTFEWDFEDPDSGDSQTAYDLRYRVQGTSTWTDLSDTSTVTSRTISGGTFTAGSTYEWQVRTTDTSGEVGPYSTSEFFDAEAQPSAPTIDDPTLDQVIGSETYTVAWTTATQNAYRLRVVGDSAGSPDTGTVLHDTGIVESAATRTRSAPFPTKLVTRHVQVQVRYDGLWSGWASVRVDVDYTVPATPTVTLAEGSPVSAITVDATHPTPSGTEPTVDSMDVQRRENPDGEWVTIAAGLDPDDTYADYAVASGTLYDYRVVARASSNGTTSTSAAATGSVTLSGVWLHDPTDPAGTVHHFPRNQEGGDDDTEYEMSTRQFAGRTHPVAEFGEAETFNVAADLQLLSKAAVAALKSLAARKSVLLYRDGSGRRVFGVAGRLPTATTAYGGTARLRMQQVDHDEAV